jgi:hypothetical protein
MLASTIARRCSSDAAALPIARPMSIRVPGSCRRPPVSPRLLRASACAALAAVVLAAPAAASAAPRQSALAAPVARQSSIAEGVATGLALEIVKGGIKAAVAKWAPDLTKYVDPVGAGLAQIQAQLAEIERKLTELVEKQDALEQHLNCVTQRVALDHVLSDAESWFSALRGAANNPLPSARETTFARLFNNYDAMVSDQKHLHRALIGADGVIRACARHIETGLKPYISARLADDVDNFYAVYRTAAAELLIVRVNMMALHTDQFSDSDAKNAAAEVDDWWKGERSLIKPRFPSSMSYDTSSGWLWRFTTIPWWDNATMTRLGNEGWHVTGRSTIPTCSGVEAFVKRSKLSGSAALAYLRELNVIDIPSGNTILCYDDSDRIHDFSLVNYSYRYAGNDTSQQPSVAARPNDGLVDISAYSYLNG